MKRSASTLTEKRIVSTEEFYTYLDELHHGNDANMISLFNDDAAFLNELPWNTPIDFKQSINRKMPLQIFINQHEKNNSAPLILLLGRVDLSLLDFNIVVNQNTLFYNLMSECLKNQEPILMILKNANRNLIDWNAVCFEGKTPLYLATLAAKRGNDGILNSLLDTIDIQLLDFNANVTEGIDLGITPLLLLTLALEVGITQPLLKILQHPSIHLNKLKWEAYSTQVNTPLYNIINHADKHPEPLHLLWKKTQATFYTLLCDFNKKDKAGNTLISCLSKLTSTENKELFLTILQHPHFNLKNICWNDYNQSNNTQLTEILNVLNKSQRSLFINILLQKVPLSLLHLDKESADYKTLFYYIMEDAAYKNNAEHIHFIFENHENIAKLINTLAWDALVTSDDVSLLYWTVKISKQSPEILQFVIEKLEIGKIDLNAAIKNNLYGEVNIFEKLTCGTPLYIQCKIYQQLGLYHSYLFSGDLNVFNTNKFLSLLHESEKDIFYNKFHTFIEQAFTQIEKNKGNYSKKHYYTLGLLLYTHDNYELAFKAFCKIPKGVIGFEKANEYISMMLYHKQIGVDSKNNFGLESEEQRESRLLKSLQHILIADNNTNQKIIKHNICVSYLYGEKCKKNNPSSLIELIKGDYQECANALKEMKGLIKIEEAYEAHSLKY